MTNFEKVGNFMKTFGQEVKEKPSLSSEKINKLRIEGRRNANTYIDRILISESVIGDNP